MTVSVLHCYIVDDDLSFGRSLKRLLNAGGMAADCFTSAQSFLDSVPPSQTGCAIVDIHMPGFDGFWLMNKMHDLCYVMPVVIMTGQTGADTGELALAKGAVGFLQKPFSADDIGAVLGRIQPE